MQLIIERMLPDAVLPTKRQCDAGYDVYTPQPIIIPPHEDLLVGLGWRCEFDENYAMVMIEKSGRATKDKLTLGARLIDSGYRGEVMVHLFNNTPFDVFINAGEKIAQFILININHAEIVEGWVNFNTERNEGGFGSTGVK